MTDVSPHFSPSTAVNRSVCGVCLCVCVCGAAAETLLCEHRIMNVSLLQSLVPVCVSGIYSLFIHAYTRRHTHILHILNRNMEALTWMMSDSPARLLFLPSLWVFPHSLGRSWVFLQVLYRAPLDSQMVTAANTSSTIAGSRFVFAKLPIVHYSAIIIQSTHCLADPLPPLKP